MYKFKNYHPVGSFATYYKETKKIAYLRIFNPDGSMNFYFSYLEDLSHEKYLISQEKYKSIRGIPEWCLEWGKPK